MSVIQQLAECILDKRAFTDERECIVKDPFADIFEIEAVIDKSRHAIFYTSGIQLKYVNDEYQYVLNNKIRRSDCPPLELECLLTILAENDDDRFYAFLYFCERNARKYAVAAARATDAAAADVYAAEYARQLEFLHTMGVRV